MIRPIAIEAVSNGWIVTVGCQRIVFTSVRTLTVMLADYLTTPEQTEKVFTATAVNIRHTLNGGPVPVGNGADAVPTQGWPTPRNETAYATGEPGYLQTDTAPAHYDIMLGGIR